VLGSGAACRCDKCAAIAQAISCSQLEYLPPEVLLAGPAASTALPALPQNDTWAVGLLTLEQLMGRRLWTHLGGDLGALLRKLLRVILAAREATGKSPRTALHVIAAEHFLPLPDDERLVSFLTHCLALSPSERPEPGALLAHPFLASSNAAVEMRSVYRRGHVWQPRPVVASAFMDAGAAHAAPLPMPIRVVYHLWTLSCGGLQQYLVRSDEIAPILRVPKFLPHGAAAVGAIRDPVSLFDPTPIVVSALALVAELEGVSDDGGDGGLEMMREAPLSVRETDPRHQYGRIRLFEALLASQPLRRQALIASCRHGIPRFFRGPVWSTLLNHEVSCATRSNSLLQHEINV
jgi:hypothetical protein